MNLSPSSSSAAAAAAAAPGAKTPSEMDEFHQQSLYPEQALQNTTLSSETPITYHYLDFDTEIPGEGQTIRSKDSTPSRVKLPPPPQVHLRSPFDWPRSRKNVMILIACIAATVASFSASAYSAGASQMAAEWNVGRIAALAGITAFTAGFAITPMVLAPFSEIQGRKPVFLCAGVLYMLCTLCCALTHSYAGMIVARFLSGASSSTFSTIVGGLISDLYRTDQRNTPMSIFSGAAIFGIGLGPVVAGFIAEYTTWRWIFYIQVIWIGILVLLMVIGFKETRSGVILRQNARTLNRWYEKREQTGIFGHKIATTEGVVLQRIRWKIEEDEQRGSLGRLLWISLTRPFELLFTEPVVFVFSLWAAFSWSVLYLCFSVTPLVFQSRYQMSISHSNAIFASCCIGTILATIISILQEQVAKKFNKLPPTPEARLYFSCIEGAFLPIGLFLFGWSAASQMHWTVLMIAIGIATIGIFAIYLAVFNYLADAYGSYASSALAAQSFCRNALGGSFPLVTQQMYERLGYGGASSLLGAIAILLSIVPWVLVLYGEEIRRRSKFASSMSNKDKYNLDET